MNRCGGTTWAATLRAILRTGLRAKLRRRMRPVGWAAALLALGLALSASRGTQAAVSLGPVREVRDIETAAAGVLRPAGLAYSPDAAVFYVLPALEADATDATIGFVDFVGPDAKAVRPGFPTAGLDAAFDAGRRQLVLFDGAANEAITIAARPSGDLGSAVTRRAVPQLGSVQARGIAVNTSARLLFLLDGRSRRIAVIPESHWGVESGSGAFEPLSWIDLPDLPDLPGSDLRGLAFDSSTHRFYVLDARARVVYELGEGGEMLRGFDLGAVRLQDPGGLVLAPSGDLTDDPARTSLYIADAGAQLEPRSGRIVELALTEAQVTATATATASLVSSSLVRTIETWRWSPPSPDPSGLAYDPAANRLLVSDGEVEEMSIWAGANYFEASLTGSLVRTSSTRSFSNEPVGAAYAGTGRVFISDDDKQRVFQVILGNDGRPGTSDDSVSSFGTLGFGSGDPESVSYDPINGRLFIADGVNAEIYEVLPVDGVFGNGNDQIRHFDTERLGVTDPETVEFNADTGTLYTIGVRGDKVVEVTTSGTLVSEIDSSFLPLARPAGLAYAPRSTDAGQKSLYIADRKVDNNDNSKENDGAIYEIAIASPVGSGGPETTITSGPPTVTNSTSASFSFTSSVTGSSFQCAVDAASFATCSSPARYSGLAEGSHSFRVRAIDSAGNVDPTPASSSWTIDLTRPETMIDSGPSGTTSSTTASFSFSSNEANSTFQCSLDAGSYAACSSPTTYSGLANGSHTFQVRATDPAGNTDQTPAARTWTVDTTSGPTTLPPISPNADARVEQANASTNFGSNSVLIADLSPVEETYLRFTVSGVSGTVQSAKLRLFAYNGTNNGPALYTAANSWTETDITWNTKPARTSGVIGNQGALAANIWVEYDVTSIVTADGAYTFNLAAESSDGTYFYSREATNPNKPALVVTFG